MTMPPKQLAVLLLILSLGMAHAARAADVTIGAGAGYKRLVTELDAAFSRKTGVVVHEAYGHLGHVAAQAREGGPIDVIIGDLDFLHSVPGLDIARVADVGRGRLVVAWAAGVDMESPSDLLRPGIDRIALPDEKNAIYGKAGMEFLSRSNMLETLRPRLIQVASVPQVTAYLISGDVEAGLINITDAQGVRGKIGGFAEVDQNLYSPIRIVGALMPGGAGKPETARYLEFLVSPEARAIAEKHGL